MNDTHRDKKGLHSERVLWLERAYVEIRRRLLKGKATPSLCRVHVVPGFPHRGARPGPHQVRGLASEAMMKGVSRSKADVIEIHLKEFVDPIRCLASLLHEMVHLTVGAANGHRRKFQTLARLVGFEEPFIQPTPSEELKERLRKVTSVIGNMPAGYAFLPARKPRSAWSYRCSCPRPQRFQSHGKNPIRAICSDCHQPFIVTNTPQQRIPPSLPPGSWDIEELAQTLGIGVRTVWDHVHEGKLPPPATYLARRAYWFSEQFDSLESFDKKTG